jgi:hypothetical protein
MKKVWIELPEAKDLEDAKAHCEAANAMLRKLGVDYDVFWATDQQRYTSTFYNGNQGPEGTFTELEDRGKWFNLDYLAASQPVESLDDLAESVAAEQARRADQ